MTAKEQFSESSFDKLKKAIESIPEKDTKDIYALSFWFYTDNDDPRYPRIAVSYNTVENFRSETENATGEAEAKWNYAYWLQEEIGEIGGDEDVLLSEWFRETSWYYSEEQNVAAAKDDALFNRLLDQGYKFDEEFIELVIALTQQLFSESVISGKFGKNIPILVHELEYYDEPVSWTKRANPEGLADEFVKAYEDGEL